MVPQCDTAKVNIGGTMLKRIVASMLLVSSFLLAGCGGSSTASGPDAGDTTVFFRPSDVGPGTPDFAPLDFGAVDLPVFDQSGVPCKPGDGCFGDECGENSQCQSKYCVQPLADMVCTMPCQEECPEGWACKQVASDGPDVVFICISDFPTLCRPCLVDDDCASVGGADSCVAYGDAGSFCGGECTDAGGECPAGYECVDSKLANGGTGLQCVPAEGECDCSNLSAKQQLSTFCYATNESGQCKGTRTCTAEGLTTCSAVQPQPESCNGDDDDCDGQVDGMEEPCSSTCGDGVKTCEDGSWSTCSTAAPIECMDYETCEVEDYCIASCPAPPEELCNSLDDDCDQEVDETFDCLVDSEEQELCGNCGAKIRKCQDNCAWSELGECINEGECYAGQVDTQTCGNCGTKTRVCSEECVYAEFGDCIGEGVCAPGATKEQPCGLCGTQTATCSDACSWSDFTGCVDNAVCTPGQNQSQACGNCGMQYRSCGNDCQWPAWGSCDGQGQCSLGQSQSQNCGFCGTQQRQCNNNCWWDPWGSCNGQGVCNPGATQGGGCPNSCMTMACGSNCQWSDGCTSCGGCNSYFKCGLSCPNTHHATSYNYSMSCGSSCCNDNQAKCEPNCGSSFFKCGLMCPAGYHPTSYNYSMSCGSSCCNDNQAKCEVNAGFSFYKCGMGCPQGYHAVSYNYSMSCGSSCCNDNQTKCDRD